MTEKLLAMAWTFLNSGPGLLTLGSAVLWVLNAVYAKRPGYRALLDKYEGTIIAAVRAAEKAIPDGVPAKSAARLDQALKLILAVYAQRSGREASPAMVGLFAEAAQVVHSKLEAEGALGGPEL